MNGTIRAFIALELPDRIKDRADELQRALRAGGLNMRWVKPQNLHLTLKFLGDIPGADVPRISLAIEAAAADEPHLEMSIKGMGAFPGIRRPRVVWLGLGGEIERLKMLHQRIEGHLVQLGYAREKRGFQAHLTIARTKGGVAPGLLLQAMRDAGDFAPVPFNARELVLFKSDLRPHGAKYTRLAETRLT